jgi:cytochrome c oxidase assembly protein subunit 15
MNSLAKVSLLLVIVLVSLSAYLRLAHSGIGCDGWPECYGRIGEPPSTTQPVSSEKAYQRMLEEANKPMSWATPLHRLVASVLGLLVVALFFVSLRQKRQRIISLALLGLTVFLAVLGIRSGSLHNPAVVMGNLAGGFLMLGLLGWMVFSAGDSGTTTQRNPGLKGTVFAAIAVLCLQIFLGGLTSANFAATSCQTLPDCHGSWLPGGALLKAMDLTREHEVTSSGQAIGGEERLAIHKAHRLGSVLALAMAFIAAVMALRAGFRSTAIVILVFVTLEFSVGIAAILSSLPIGLAVAHNWLAGLTLLALLKLMALIR